MNTGLIILLVVICGYISNWLNWKFLNYKLTHYLYYIGAFVHESSHALACIITGAKIREYKVFTSQPHVVHTKSHIPILGSFLISIAPLFGGIFFIYLINHYLLGSDNIWHNLNIFTWQTWILILLLINVGAMIGPSFQDIKNMWPAFIILFFIDIPMINTAGMFALSLIGASILIQVVAIISVKVVKLI
jgi:hypothetical protein